MPRTSRKAAAEQPKTLIAAASNLTRPNRPKTQKQPVGAGKSWQEQAWYFLDSVGELQFGVNYLANAMSRVTLSIGEEQDDGSINPVESGPAVDALNELLRAVGGVGNMMATFGAHLFLPGESFLIGIPPSETDPDADEDTWYVASSEEVSQRGTRWTVDRGLGPVKLPDDAVVIRIWRPHPKRYYLPTSSVRAALPVLRELEQLTKHVAAQIDSRLAGAGILLLPSEMSFTPPAGDDSDGSDPQENPFVASLTVTMITAIEDRSNASAVVPIVITAPGEFLGNAQHLTFNTPLSVEAQSLRDEAIRRLALAVDLPPEVMLGQSDSNHWSAWQIDEDSIKIHIEPAVGLVATALTTQFIRAVVDGADRLVVVGDTSELRQRPDRSAQAFQLYALGLISAKALLRETGFDEGDMPDDNEVKRILLWQAAQAGATPELAEAALAELGLDLTPAPAPNPDNSLPGPRVPRALPAPPAKPDPAAPAPAKAPTAIPVQPQAASAEVLVAAALPLVARAVERAYSRAGRRGANSTGKPLSGEQIDAGLVGAWDRVPEVANLLNVDAVEYTVALDHYARGVLTSGAQPETTVLTRLLRGEG